ncbi:hypothetical protein GCM10010123_41190 [Pilimelia anulata]|uniref:Uncharacterized protein n=1 Tax=Pilimelia anulata TaxID=53371 RepID=A0A8J3FCS7_9ACTN|nr:hypothetical protein [Pilimelia anulata]GGK07136.1 hypothetical protein GCM10010123_41190 [Pilimelia anulata]
MSDELLDAAAARLAGPAADAARARLRALADREPVLRAGILAALDERPGPERWRELLAEWAARAPAVRAQLAEPPAGAAPAQHIHAEHDGTVFALGQGHLAVHYHSPPADPPADPAAGRRRRAGRIGAAGAGAGAVGGGIAAAQGGAGALAPAAGALGGGAGSAAGSAAAGAAAGGAGSAAAGGAGTAAVAGGASAAGGSVAGGAASVAGSALAGTTKLVVIATLATTGAGGLAYVGYRAYDRTTCAAAADGPDDEAVRRAALRTANDSFRFAITAGPHRLDGVRSAAAGTFRLSGAAPADGAVLGDDLYLVGAGGAATAKLSVAGLAAADPRRLGARPLAPAEALDRIRTIRRDGCRYRGTLAADRAGGPRPAGATASPSPAARPSPTGTAGDGGGDPPFSALVDERGRLASIELGRAGTAAHTAARYDGFGLPVAVARPSEPPRPWRDLLGFWMTGTQPGRQYYFRIDGESVHHGPNGGDVGNRICVGPTAELRAGPRVRLLCRFANSGDPGSAVTAEFTMVGGDLRVAGPEPIGGTYRRQR